MRRRVLTVLSAVSLVMGALTCLLWVRSEYRHDECAWVTPGAMYIEACSRLGQSSVSIVRGWPNRSPGYYTGDKDNRIGPLYCDAAGFSRRSEWGGFAYVRGFFSVATVAGQPVISQNESGLLFAGRADAWPMLRGWEIHVPDSFLALVFAAAPACTLLTRWRAARQRHRSARGLCPNCGYDLRATPECCPECGTEPKKV